VSPHAPAHFTDVAALEITPARESLAASSVGAPLSGDTLERDARRRIVARATLIGVWVWPVFIVVDAWMSFVAYPGAPFTRFLLYRILVEAVLVATYAASRRSAARIELLVQGQNLAFALAGTAIALMAVDLGGIRSPYMHGISIVALVRAVVIPELWRRAWPHFAWLGLVFPAVMAAGSLLSPQARMEWLAHDALIVFASNYIFVLTSAVLGLIGSSVVWRAQQQLYRARRVGRYRLQAPIGKGGMGEVWLAWDLSLQRNVALKILRVTADAGPEAVARFEREALAASRLQSPHVIQIFDYGASDDGLYYIAMEYLDGVDLQTLVERDGPVEPTRAIQYVMQACIALEVAHAAGVIHRDIKPHNLFLCRGDDETGLIKLLDFGIVRLRDRWGDDITWTGMVVGTPVYVAPELWRGHAADERSDIYGLGVTFYFLLTGRTPFAKVEVSAKPAAQQLTTGPVSLSVASPLQSSLETLVSHCLARNPAQRVQSARTLHRELAELLAQSAVTIVPVGAEPFSRTELH
jgi:eukaryotic-like serine/threonine-protein kinase